VNCKYCRSSCSVLLQASLLLDGTAGFPVVRWHMTSNVIRDFGTANTPLLSNVTPKVGFSKTRL
jgi:hypothetical protein